jgi:hypothetical protein
MKMMIVGTAVDPEEVREMIAMDGTMAIIGPGGMKMRIEDTLGGHMMMIGITRGSRGVDIAPDRGRLRESMIEGVLDLPGGEGSDP